MNINDNFHSLFIKYIRMIISKGFKSIKKYRVLNYVKRLVIILLDPICDDSQCYFSLPLNPFKIITLIYCLTSEIDQL